MAIGICVYFSIMVTAWLFRDQICFKPPFFIIAQVMLTSRLNTKLNVESRPVTLFVFSLIGVTCVAALIVLTFASAHAAGMANFRDNNWRLNWSKDNPGYRLHIICTAIEWIGLVGCSAIIFACLARRMARFDEWHKVPF